MIFVPSAFTSHTGRDHWEVLLRARSIENQAYVIAPTNVVGIQRNSPVMVIRRSSIPGAVCWHAPEDGEAIVSSEIDLAQLAAVRKQLPALSHRRDW